MHELSVACSLIDLAEQAARDAGAQRVVAVRLQLGALSGVVRDALDFSFGIATQNTLLEGARLEIEELPLLLHCAVCDSDVQPLKLTSFRCPICQTPSADIRQGKELEIVSIEIEEPIGMPEHG